MEAGRVNIPNTLTVLRIIMVPVIVILLMQGDFLKALVLFALSGITDGLDGFLARVLDQQTELGAYLDPIADKALMVSCFVTLSIKHVIPGWLSVIVVSRDCIILIGIAMLAIMSISFQIRPTMISKLTTVFQLLTIFSVLLVHTLAMAEEYKGLLMGLYILTSVLTIASGLNYIFKGIHFINSTT
ncbi:MAG TPA: CDP-alcohol phosphatidyltransferase family protein [Syntrophales bacterium]|jgi:cardiolipin synthase|nr:CDP-alcohol phosphatidyltransferase family protein [Syntrophales bacterium]HON24124.1 CDP-alcohol phosphatidyltransferase family protein [Syntrophales bacterium]HOU77720.1 CDP-alcohol phosphatidyltransferase family protein [Syntrophales bacterium]HPC32096.1 CDP-alcohol phosphatidyltransferase family protein [Syntrophales bacterium]HQG33737.1 CDP-alcohol phosphatidyltransferase family protein [Syntrophales bacterium]